MINKSERVIIENVFEKMGNYKTIIYLTYEIKTLDLMIEKIKLVGEDYYIIEDNKDSISDIEVKKRLLEGYINILNMRCK